MREWHGARFFASVEPHLTACPGGCAADLTASCGSK